MPVREQRLLLVAAASISALLLVAALAGHPELLAYAAPLFVLALPLIAGRYVGEDRLERMRGSAEPRRSRVPVAGLLPGRPAVVSVARGGRLIADALARRGPPRLALN